MRSGSAKALKKAEEVYMLAGLPSVRTLPNPHFRWPKRRNESNVELARAFTKGPARSRIEQGELSFRNDTDRRTYRAGHPGTHSRDGGALVPRTRHPEDHRRRHRQSAAHEPGQCVSLL